MKIYITALLLAMTATSCSAQHHTAKHKTAIKNTNSMQTTQGLIYLTEGQNIFLKDQKLNITFKRIVEDSRCPEGTNCVWAGAATVEVEVMGLATRPRTLQISTVDNAGKNLAKTALFNGFAISLAEVSPKKNNQGAGQPARIGLKIERAGTIPNPKTARGAAEE